VVTLEGRDPIAGALLAAIRGGDLEALDRLIGERPELASARIVDDKGGSRTPLHIATDWPGHFPNGPAAVRVLLEAGADPNAPVEGSWHSETPLHWAASSDDVEVLDALLDGGADIEAQGASIAGGPPLDDAVGYGQWRVARRLVERGAQTKLWHAAALEPRRGPELDRDLGRPNRVGHRRQGRPCGVGCLAAKPRCESRQRAALSPPSAAL
jgi:hypothetical protein